MDGTISILKEDSKRFKQWKRSDYIVTSWIMHSISKELMESFTSTPYARDLWLELIERYGESNVLLIYQFFKKN